MSIASKLTLWAGIMLPGVFLVGCNKTADYDLQSINDVSLQLSGFGIRSTSDTGLANYFFSITNKSESGLISNSIPLPYGTELKDVLLSLDFLRGYSGAVTAKVAIGDAAAETWDATKKYTIPADTELTISVSNRADVSQTYTYKVKINQYKYDPETIQWARVNTSSTDLLSGNQACLTFTSPTDKMNYFVKQGTRQFYLLSETGAPVPVEIEGLAADENVKRIVANENSVYALGTLGTLYKLEGMVWNPLPSAESVYDLLGILPAYGTEKSVSLALLLTPNRSITLDLSLAADKRAVFAVYRDGDISTSNYYAPSVFPSLKSSDYFVAYSKTASYEGASIELIGTTSSEELGKTYRSTWFTTNGTKWAAYSTLLEEISMPTAISVLRVGDVYYRLESNSAGLNIYYSSDKLNWTKSSDVAVMGLDVAAMKQSRFVAWNKGEYIYMLQGSGATTTLWQGKIKKSDIE